MCLCLNIYLRFKPLASVSVNRREMVTAEHRGKAVSGPGGARSRITCRKVLCNIVRGPQNSSWASW